MTPNFAKERLAVLLDQACEVAKEIGGPWLEKLVGEWTSIANTYRVVSLEEKPVR